jgi:hypothetical protein
MNLRAKEAGSYNFSLQFFGLSNLAQEVMHLFPVIARTLTDLSKIFVFFLDPSRLMPG